MVLVVFCVKVGNFGGDGVGIVVVNGIGIIVVLFG